MIDEIIELTREYGFYIYVLMFIWAFFEGETFVIFSGVVASLGYLDASSVFLAAWLGSFCGDQCYFWIGRRWGVPLLKRMPRWQPGVETALYFLRRYNTGFIFSFRFIYGVRNFASFAMGLSGLDPIRFAVLNFAAALVWAAAFSGAGYLIGHLFGDAIEFVLKHAIEFFGFTMLAVCIFAVVIVYFAIHGKRRPALATKPAATPTGGVGTNAITPPRNPAD